MFNLDIQVQVIDERLKKNLPQYATPGSAAMDLRACIDQPLTLAPGEVKLISTGMKIFIGDPNFAAMIMPRSGMGHKNGIILGNTIGLIDSDYQGVLQMSIWNRSDKAFIIAPMERIAQLMFVPVVQPTIRIVDEFEENSSRGSGGFGSTGT